MDLSIDLSENRKLNYRVCALLIFNNKILLQGSDQYDFWVLPGGRCQFGETSDLAIKRELKEELRVTFEQLTFQNSLENLFNLDGKMFHEISFFYREEISELVDHLHHNGEFKLADTEGQLQKFKWVAIEDLHKEKVFPVFLRSKEHIYQKDFKHFIINEL